MVLAVRGEEDAGDIASEARSSAFLSIRKRIAIFINVVEKQCEGQARSAI